ncbi:MAG: ATP synthase F1 subunit delta [Acidobacteria bacterium]|nr:ATP synthase F1 subunit delta [Acidobacteriota bacterium]MCA1611204.1 ATP synthase F1 subunit delta [Acidobacteriota bacterium]
MSAFARSYARAALESAPAGYDFDRLVEGAGAVRRALDSDARLKEFFAAPSIPRAPKERALEALAVKAGLDDFGRRLLRVILDHGRLSKLSEILSALSQGVDRSRGVNEAHVTVAAPIGPQEEKKIADALGRSVGGTVRLRVAVDENILGGFVARVGSRVIDASVASAIERFQEKGKESARA